MVNVVWPHLWGCPSWKGKFDPIATQRYVAVQIGAESELHQKKFFEEERFLLRHIKRSMEAFL